MNEQVAHLIAALEQIAVSPAALAGVAVIVGLVVMAFLLVRDALGSRR